MHPANVVDDAEWLAQAEFLLQTVPAAAMVGEGREMLRDLVDGAALTTTLGHEVVLMLTRLDLAFGIDGMIDDAFFVPGGRTASNPPAPAMPSTQRRQTNAPSSQVASSGQPGGNAAATAMPRAPTLAQQTAPTDPDYPSTYDAGSGHQVTFYKDPRYKFVCDVCGHAVMYRNEFNRHVCQGTGRRGFKVVHAVPEIEMIWYGEDNDGNQYRGAIIASSGPSSGPRPKIPEPCRSRIADFKEEDKKRKEAEKEAKAAEEAE